MRRPALRLLLATAGLLLGLSGCAPRHDALDRHASSPPPGAAALAEKLDADFRRVRDECERLAASVVSLYARRNEILPSVDTTRYAFAPNGAFHKIDDDGGAALWISAVEPITEEVRRVAYFTEPLDTDLARICREFPEVSQAYYNDRHSVNRIHPWFDTIAQYPPRMNIPEFNFYYLADAAHNPSRRGVWVDEPYVDPAGRGWMVSAIAPVYVADRLEGVPGLDVTIGTLVNRYFEDDARAIAVISRQGVLVAATDSAIQHLEMPPLKGHKYLETVKLDTFKPDEYNILKSTLRPVRAMAAAILAANAGPAPTEIELQGEPHVVHTARVGELGWTVIELLPR